MKTKLQHIKKHHWFVDILHKIFYTAIRTVEKRKTQPAFLELNLCPQQPGLHY